MRRSVTAGFAAVLVAGLLPLLAPVTADAAPGSAAAPTASSVRGGPKYKILVLVSAGYGKAEKNGVQQLRQLGLDRGFTLEVTDDTSVVTAANLATYRAVTFLNTTGDYLTDAQQSAFESYFRAGGGFVGIGSAVELEPGWAFLTDVIGSRSTAKLDAQTVTNKVADRVHDASKNLPEYWNLNDTYYNWTSNVRGVSHVLTTVSDAPFTKTGDGPTINALTGGTMGADHPVTWCKDYQGGRSYYTNHGASAAAWSDANLVKELVGALVWASGQSDTSYSDCGATVLANYQQVKISSPPNVSEPIGFDQLPDGRVIQTDRRGGVRLHNPTSGTTTILANVPVYTNSEDGLYGPGIDNNFANNHWVYLYYAPPVATDITYADGTSGHTNNFTVAPFLNGAAPTQAADLSAWDAWIGYFQLSRFKFVDDAPGAPAHLDLSSEQQILRVPNNRGACCHVAGDIDFDKDNNLWFVTGDDSAAGSGDAGNWGQSIDQKTDENQTIRVSGGATGGTFTLTFNGQTTAPLPFNATAAQISTALGALSTIGSANIQATGGPVNTANVLATWKGTFEEKDVPSLTSDASGLTGGTPTVAIGVGAGAGGSNTTARQGGLWRMPAADSGRSAMNTNDLRGKINRIHVKASDIGASEANKLDLGSGGAYTVPAGNLFPLAGGAPQPKTRPEVYAMGFRNPFRIQVDSDGVAYISDYSPDSQTPQQFHGTPGTGRFEIVRKPSNYGWPYCFKPDLPEYPWNVNLQVPMNLADHQPVPAGVTPQPYDCGNPAGVPNNDWWNLNGGPSVEPGRAVTPALTSPDIWYSYRDNNAAAPLGTPCFTFYGPDALTAPAVAGSTTSCPRLFPELYTGGVGPHGAAKYEYDPANPNPTKFPPYYDNSVILGEFTQDTLREAKLDSNNQILKINSFLNCGQFGARPATSPFECDNPMDMQWGADGDFYLLTYGDGFFAINPDAGMYKWEYVKGTRAPKAILTTDRTDGPAPLTVNFSSAGSLDPDPGDSIRFDWDFGDGSVHSVDPNPSHTYSTRGRYTASLTVTDSSGKTAATSTVITAGNTSPTVTLSTPVDGGMFAFGDDIPFSLTVTDPEDGPVICSEVQVTFVLGHDTHGHAEAGTTGCSGVLHTDAGDVAHGGNVFGVISATYTDHGVGHDNVQTLATTSQKQIRQKHQEVEFVVNQSGTNTGTNNDGGPTPPPASGVHRGSLAAGDWLQLNGPFNLLNINSLTFRVADNTAGRTAGSPLGAIEVHRDTVAGPVVATANLTSTGDPTVWSSQTIPISDSGTHEYFLVFQNVTGGATGSMFLLNWAEFGGPGVAAG
jgi:PKD repeat protein/type 1 glutamine amidotransferase